MKHSDNLQVLRGVAASLIFVVHYTLIERKVEGHPGLTGNWGWIGSISVDLFFVISGFIMVAIARGRFGMPGEASRFLLERAGRIYPTYWLVSLIVLAVYLVRPSWVNSAQGNRVDLLASFLLLPQPLLPLLAVGWTLIHEVYFYVVFALLIAWLPERRLPWGLGAWALGVIGVERSLAGHGSAWIDLVSNPMTLEFIAGGLAAWFAPRLPRSTAYPALALAPVWLGIALSIEPLALADLFPHPWPRTLVCAVPCTLLTLAAVLLDRPGRAGRVQIATRWLGDRSYSFYLTHLLMLSLLAKLWSLAPSPTLWDNLLVFVVGFASCVGVAAATFRWFERPVLRATKRMLERFMPRAPTPLAPLASRARHPV